MIFQYILLNYFAFLLIVLSLFMTHPCFFFISHQILGKSFKFVNHVLQTNESFVPESNFSSSLSLSLSLSHSGPFLWEMSKQFLYKYQYQPILCFGYSTRNDTGKCYIFDTNTEIQKI